MLQANQIAAEDGFVDSRCYFNTTTLANIENLLGNVGVVVAFNVELKSVILEKSDGVGT